MPGEGCIAAPAERRVGERGLRTLSLASGEHIRQGDPNGSAHETGARAVGIAAIAAALWFVASTRPPVAVVAPTRPDTTIRRAQIAAPAPPVVTALSAAQTESLRLPQ